MICLFERKHQQHRHVKEDIFPKDAPTHICVAKAELPRIKAMNDGGE